MSELKEKLELAKSGAESLYAFCEGEWYQDLAKAIRDTLTDAIESLTPSLDENGLVRCGCGGSAVRIDGLDAYGNYTTTCHDCGTYAWDHRSQAEADKAWNTAMGWRADE